jgi:hypothetical protein
MCTRPRAESEGCAPSLTLPLIRRQTVPELLNRFGADGWELAGLHDYRDGGDVVLGGGPVADGVHLQTASP